MASNSWYFLPPARIIGLQQYTWLKGYNNLKRAGKVEEERKGKGSGVV